MNEKIPEILRQIETVVVGKNEIVEKILMAILAGGHVLMEDVPGVGKTTTAMTFAKVLGLDTKRVQFTSDTVPSDIIGYSVYDKESGSFVYKPGAVMTNLLLADEINRTSSKTQSALLEAMEELHVTVDGKTYELPQPFVVLATQNPVGSAGTQMLPPSQMDRFMIKISMGYPDFESQISILRDRHTENPLNRVTPVVDREQLQALIQEAAKAEIQDAVYEYVTRLTQASREHPMVQLGVSPRGALAVCRMAKAYAYLNGRDFVIPEDVAAVFPDVCCHRLVLTTKARMMEERPETVIAAILDAYDRNEIGLGGAGGHLRLAYPVLREQRRAGSGGGAAGSASGQPPDPPFPEKTASGAGGSTRRGAERGRGRRHDLSGKPHAAARPAYPLPGNDPESAERRALYPECHDMGVPERAAAHVPALGKRVLRTHPDLRGAGEAL